jgi:recombinational DNA repair ATPase RecF
VTSPSSINFPHLQQKKQDLTLFVWLFGLNGSGKSNLIELIADIFSYADRYFNKLYRYKEDLGYDFNITYTIDIRDQPKQIQLSCERSKIITNDNK